MDRSEIFKNIYPSWSHILMRSQLHTHYAVLLPLLALVSVFLEKKNLILGAFTKLIKATTSFVMSVRLSVRVEQLCSHWKDFHEILNSNTFRKSFEKI